MVNNIASQTFNNYQSALYALYDNAIIPLINKIFEDLTVLFLNRGLLSEGEKLSYDASHIPALRLRVNEELKMLSQIGIVSINEMRSLYGKESIGEEGDQLYIPSTIVPIGRDANTDDNRDKPTKKFSELMKANGATEEEIYENWNQYKSIIGAD